MRLSPVERGMIANILEKATTMRKKDPKMRTIGFPALFRLCSTPERKLLKKFLLIHPRVYGFKGMRYGISASPKDLVMIRRERVPNTIQYLSTGTHFLPSGAYDAYKRMNRAMIRDIGRRVYVLSGYRSPAYQLVVFLETLKAKKFNIKNTAKRVALPGYSEHGAPKTQAVDFTTLRLRGEGTDSLVFEETKEYEWLTRHAEEFGFTLSYPRGNKFGVMFEPWHWSYCAMVQGKGSGKL